MMNGFTDDLMLWFPGYCISIQGICHIFVMKGVEWVHSNGRHLTDYLGVGRNFNYQDNIETDDWFISHDTIKFIVKKVNHCCFSGTALQTFSLRLLGGGVWCNLQKGQNYSYRKNFQNNRRYNYWMGKIGQNMLIRYACENTKGSFPSLPPSFYLAADALRFW